MVAVVRWNIFFKDLPVANSPIYILRNMPILLLGFLVEICNNSRLILTTWVDNRNSLWIVDCFVAFCVDVKRWGVGWIEEYIKFISFIEAVIRIIVEGTCSIKLLKHMLRNESSLIKISVVIVRMLLWSWGITLFWCNARIA